MPTKKSPTIPKLPRGLGSMCLTKNNTIEYKKCIRLKDGTQKRLTVHGNTPSECIKKMSEREQDILNNSPQPPQKQTLYDAMILWLESTKKYELKPQAYRRELGTIRNQIGSSKLAHFRYQSITPEEITQLLNELNDKGYSYSVIKKTHDSLSAFYRHMSARYKFDNPMLFVSCIKKEYVNKPVKEMSFFTLEDIERFVAYIDTRYKNGKLKYPTGYALAANIFLGLRIGELLALQWKDIDFEKKTISVSKTLIEIDNPEYDVNNVEEMKKKEIKKVLFTIQSSTKTKHNRQVPMNSNALLYLRSHLENSIYTEPDDFVITTRNRKTSTPKNISDTLKCIVKGAELSTQNYNTHILRHTCASLYFKSNVDLLTISNILGNSPEVLAETYVHFQDEQLKEAACKQSNLLPTLSF
ncbi:site-specific integrase [Mediterraneibacter glycyrrhizinilyticus]|uniref:tyrosine-type recombinase/integrase n=1 Tax=Mediterraneibacter glycyrrhizinilyticus TaxID=342942 RepID=UPI0036F3E0CF